MYTIHTIVEDFKFELLLASASATSTFNIAMGPPPPDLYSLPRTSAHPLKTYLGTLEVLYVVTGTSHLIYLISDTDDWIHEYEIERLESLLAHNYGNIFPVCRVPQNTFVDLGTRIRADTNLQALLFGGLHRG